MLEDNFLEDSLDLLLEFQLQHIKLWKASKEPEYRHFLDGLLPSRKKRRKKVIALRYKPVF